MMQVMLDEVPDDPLPAEGFRITWLRVVLGKLLPDREPVQRASAAAMTSQVRPNPSTSSAADLCGWSSSSQAPRALRARPRPHPARGEASGRALLRRAGQ